MKQWNKIFKEIDTISISSLTNIINIGCFRANQQLCDGAIRCATGHVFPVHRAILSAVSPYFKALFTNSLKGGKTETTEVAIDSVPGKIFSLILDYAYTGTCNVNADNVEQLLPLADQFEVLGVVQLCCQFLLQELRPENCLGNKPSIVN